MRLDIVMLQCGLSELTIRCLNSVYDTFDDCRVILVDNGSSFGDRLAAFNALRDPSRMLINDDNLGFAKAVNQGIAASDAPYVCILNNDTIVSPGMFDTLLAYMDGDPGLGIIGPMTNRCETEQRSDTALSPGLVYTNGLIAFFCTILRREILDDLGPLSEEYGLGYGEDDDYNIRAVQAGWRKAYAREAWMWHDHHATYKHTIGPDGIEEEGRQGLALLQEKYG